MKIFLTEEREGLAGMNIPAPTMSAATDIAAELIAQCLVPPTLKVIGELIEEINISMPFLDLDVVDVED